MSDNILLGLGINAALLLALAVLYENLSVEKTPRSRLAEIFTGVLIGLIGVMVMLTPWRFMEGVIFDTRSVLISVTGLFFGFVPTLLAVLITAALRIYQGGGGMYVGVAVILSSAALGLLYRRYLQSKKTDVGGFELYVFGLVVHLVMLFLMLFLPREIAFDVIRKIAAPVLLMYPLGVMLLGLTLQKRDQRLRLAEQLLASRERLRFQAQLLDAAGQAIIATTPEGKITYLNRAAEKLYGWTAREAQGRDVIEVTVPQATQAQAEQIMNNLRKGESWSGEFLVQNKSGKVFPALVVDAPIRTPQGALEGIVGVSQDITELKQTEEQVKRLNENLEKLVEERTRELREAQQDLIRQEKLAALGQMAGGVGHELRNPLGVISNAVYYLKMVQQGADEKAQEYLDLIEKQTNIANKIVSDLLDFTRAKSAEAQPVSIPNIAAQTLARFPAPEHIRVALQFPPDLPQAFADSQHVLQALGNLILNAYQAMPDPAKNNQLVISARMEGDMICLSVEDNGIGIPPENMKRLFEPLFTTKLKGVGLGLAVSRKLMEENGGRIEARSEPGKGSVFEIFLPLFNEDS